ncbi:Bug family tripartite tricarboxylate transporter substrate binding protein [Candidimonas nitroreducens]|uniref:LacI family transcriptional regulator n=1 Tax=Candidimonas nitroreducens TaxID=683354 RepID=A0A225MF66_9BURK|nr:tripartite tricarboxylate transporter substrate binding protein [Candidimonas nitroreducens]OWT57609.1 hypothetical protein CEY11_17105 [Candidimonas nitroreducens]
MQKSRRSLLKAFSAWPAVVLCPIAQAAENYPAKPIRFIVPFSAGGGADIVARAIAKALGEESSDQIVIDNRTGAAGIIGMQLAAQSAPDGYTIVLGQTGPMSINPWLYKNLSYDPDKDFAPITLTTVYPYVLVVNPSIAATSLKELIALARSRPNQLSFASAGTGSANHLAGELFEMMAHVSLLHVPYNAGAPAITATIGGQVSMVFGDMVSVMPFVKSGMLRAIAVTSAKRAGIAPDVPTLAEAGLPGYEAIGWHGVLAPAGTPDPIINKLNKQIVQALRTPEMRRRLAKQGAEPAGDTPAEFGRFLRADREKWGKVIKSAHIRLGG